MPLDDTDEHFRTLIQRAMSELSPEHMAALKHVAIVVADEPTDAQRETLRLRGDTLLLGLYEGVPLTRRTGYESGLMADTITIFKHAHLMISSSEAELYANIKQTVWHEIAHYFGVSHAEMDRRQGRA